MDQNARRRVLLSSPLFKALPVTALDTILAQATEKSIRKGHTVYRRGDEGSYMAAVLSGLMRVSATSSGGKEVTFNMISAGEVFGEIALLDGKPRSADVTAIVDSQLMVVERHHFKPLLEANHELALRMIDVLCERLRDTTDTLGDLATLKLPERLARKLLNLGAAHGDMSQGGVGGSTIRINIPLSDTDLARFVGCERESINKQMRAWHEDGIVARENRRVILRVPNALRRLAGDE